MVVFSVMLLMLQLINESQWELTERLTYVQERVSALRTHVEDLYLLIDEKHNQLPMPQGGDCFDALAHKAPLQLSLTFKERKCLKLLNELKTKYSAAVNGTPATSSTILFHTFWRPTSSNEPVLLNSLAQ